MAHLEPDYICEDCGSTDFIGTGVCSICGGKMLPLAELGGDDLFNDDDDLLGGGFDGGDKPARHLGNPDSLEELRDEELADKSDDENY